MESTRLIALTVFGLGAGASFVLQQTVNASLRNALGAPAWAGFVSYLGGTLCMLALAAVLREPFPAAAAWQRSNPWTWSGGFFGAVYIAISIALVPRIGTAGFIALFVAGQMAFSLALDHYGAFGITPHAVDATRVLGAALIVLGVVLVRR